MSLSRDDERAESSRLSEIQQAIYYDQIDRPQNPLYNIGGCLMIYGEVQYELLKQALQQLVDQNPALRLAFELSDGVPIQWVRAHLEVALPLLDVSGSTDPETAAADWLETQFRQAFTLDKAAVYWRFALVKISDGRYALLTQYHHLIADGWSTKIVIDSLAQLYNALLSGSACPAPECAHYLEFVDQERQYFDSPLFHRDAEFWREALPELPEPLLRHKYPLDTQRATALAHLHRFQLHRPFYDRLSQWADAEQATTYHVLLSALCLYFARTRQQSRICVGIPVLNRSGARFKKVLGMFASLSPLSVGIDLDDSPRQLLRDFASAIRKLHKHQRYPLTAINHRLQLLKNKRELLFDVVLSYEKQDYSVHFGAAQVSARQLFSGAAHYPLAVTVCEFNASDDVEIIFEGAETCFNAEELPMLAGRLQFVLQQFIDRPDMRLADIDLLPEAEKDLIFRRFNPPQSALDFSGPIGQFRYWVERTPNAPAISQQGRALSFQELDRLSDYWGHELQRLTIGVGDLVAVCMPRCIESIISLLAIWKIRAVYLPIDSDSPIDRIQALLQQSHTRLMLTTTTAAVRLSGLHEKLIFVDQLPTSPLPAQPLAEKSQADDLAYLIYTSGSTGQPKGAKIQHSALSARLAWLQKAFDIRPDDRVGQSIQTHFDPSLIEILLPLTQGACLVLMPAQRPTPEAFAEFVLTEKINALALVPSSMRLLLQGLPASGAVPLRVTCCGGETLPAGLAKAFIERTGAKLFNVYGPTETTILASAWLCSSDDSEPLPIGRPLDQTRILIVDRQLRLLPVAVAGEIVIGGAGVAEGYLGLEAARAESFFEHPDIGRIYRTGDLGYIGTDGQLYFLERLDRQVKISGYRIEPAEIESVLMQHEGVRRAAVDVVAHNQQKWLVAYVEAEEQPAKSLQRQLSEYLRRRLPDYMQPRAIMMLEALPLTAVGKVAYAQLPIPSFSSQTLIKRPPVTALETLLLGIWRQTLQNPQLDVDDNFFEQNTDSLTAISLLTAIEAATGVRHSIAFLMTYPTVAMQAGQLQQAQQQSIHADVRTLSKWLSSMHLYLAASGLGDQMRFQALADELGECCTVHMLLPPLQVDQASMETIAGEYVRVIRENRHDNVYLAGFSIAGVTALETARQLEQQGLAPRRLILLDTVYPLWPLQSPWLLKMLQWLSGRLILNRITLNDRKLQAMLTDPGIIVQLAALSRHRISPFHGAAVLVMTDGMRWLRCCLYRGWFRLLGDKLETDRVPGMHGAMFQPRHLPALSRAIKRCLNPE